MSKVAPYGPYHISSRGLDSVGGRECLERPRNFQSYEIKLVTGVRPVTVCRRRNIHVTATAPVSSVDKAQIDTLHIILFIYSRYDKGPIRISILYHLLKILTASISDRM